MYLGLANGPLDVVVGDGISDGVTNPDAVTLQQKVVVDQLLHVTVEVPGDLVTPLHGDDVQQGASLVPQCVL